MTFRLAYDANIRPAADHWAVVFYEGKVLNVDGLIIHRFNQIDLDPSSNSAPLFIGYWQDNPCFLVGLGEDTVQENRVFSSLRQQLGVVDDNLFALAGRAAQLYHWLVYHRFCGRCGERNQLHYRELMLACAACEATFYPTIAPCVIGIITRGEQCLLAHNAQFKPNLYSTLAGFIEVGESAEQAFCREVAEEVGIVIKNLHYVESQVWPFPSQLMLAFSAEYAGGEICVDGVEIVDAQWFSADNMPAIPPPETVSGRLIRAHIGRVHRPG